MKGEHQVTVTVEEPYGMDGVYEMVKAIARRIGITEQNLAYLTEFHLTVAHNLATVQFKYFDRTIVEHPEWVVEEFDILARPRSVKREPISKEGEEHGSDRGTRQSD